MQEEFRLGPAASEALSSEVRAGVTQWSECDLPKVEVEGSSPFSRLAPCRHAPPRYSDGASRHRPRGAFDLSALRARRLASMRLCRAATDMQRQAAPARIAPGRAC
jgi:hypothetical protein